VKTIRRVYGLAAEKAMGWGTGGFVGCGFGKHSARIEPDDKSMLLVNAPRTTSGQLVLRDRAEYLAQPNNANRLSPILLRPPYRVVDKPLFTRHISRAADVPSRQPLTISMKQALRRARKQQGKLPFGTGGRTIRKGRLNRETLSTYFVMLKTAQLRLLPPPCCYFQALSNSSKKIPRFGFPLEVAWARDNRVY
jgi:hypothetical protein